MNMTRSLLENKPRLPLVSPWISIIRIPAFSPGLCPVCRQGLMAGYFCASHPRNRSWKLQAVAKMTMAGVLDQAWNMRLRNLFLCRGQREVCRIVGVGCLSWIGEEGLLPWEEKLIRKIISKKQTGLGIGKWEVCLPHMHTIFGSNPSPTLGMVTNTHNLSTGKEEGGRSEVQGHSWLYRVWDQSWEKYKRNKRKGKKPVLSNTDREGVELFR